MFKKIVEGFIAGVFVTIGTRVAANAMDMIAEWDEKQNSGKHAKK